MTDAFEHLLARFEPFLGIDEFLGRGGEIGERLVASPDPERQRLEALFAGFGGFAALLGLERKVQVLESFGIVGRTNGGGQVGRQLPLAVDRLEDRLFSLGELAQPLHAELDLADHHLVQVAGGFLAVARDEGNGVPIVQEPERRSRLASAEFAGPARYDPGPPESGCPCRFDSAPGETRAAATCPTDRGIARNSYLNGKSLALLKASARRHLPTKRVRSL